VLCYASDVIQATRLLFQGLVESFLANRLVKVKKYPSMKCSKCQYPQERSMVIKRINEGKDFLCCSECGEKIILPKIEELIVTGRQDQAKIQREQVRAVSRTKFEEALVWLNNYRLGPAKKAATLKCFISYAWGVPEHERWVQTQLASDLQKAGLEVFLDKWQNARTGSNIARFIELIETSDYVIVVGTSLYRRKYENDNAEQGSIAAAEMDLINHYLMGTETEKERILPILLEGDEKKSFPPLLQRRVYSDFRNETGYFATLFDLILSIYQIPFNSQAVVDLKESLRLREEYKVK
jgi:hypothetical protein